jgi:hypothetical protein
MPFSQRDYNRLYYQKNKDSINAKRNKGIQNREPLLAGQKFNRLTVIELCEKDSGGKTCYLCRCDCGTLRKVRQTYLLHGSTKSCGCGRLEASRLNYKKGLKIAQESRRKFVGDLSGQLWSRIVRNAKTRNFVFSITKEFAWMVFLKQNRKCALTGMDLFLSPYHKDRINVTASLDRKDSSIGYTEENIQWVHKDVNLMKNNFSEKEFKHLCKMVTDYDSRPIKFSH